MGEGFQFGEGPQLGSVRKTNGGQYGSQLGKGPHLESVHTTNGGQQGSQLGKGPQLGNVYKKQWELLQMKVPNNRGTMGDNNRCEHIVCGKSLEQSCIDKHMCKLIIVFFRLYDHEVHLIKPLTSNYLSIKVLIPIIKTIYTLYTR